MGQLFGKSKGSRRDYDNNENNNRELRRREQQVSEKDKATLELKVARDRLKKYRKRLENESSELTEEAKKLIILNQRNRAMLLLKLKRHKQNALDQIDAQLLTVMGQIDQVEWALISVQVFDAIKGGTALLNKIHEEVSVDYVRALLEETNEAIEVENEINSLLSGEALSLNDEEGLLRELDALTSSSPVANSKYDLPTVPEGEITILPVAPGHEIEVNAREEVSMNAV